MKAIQISKNGGPDSLEIIETAVPEPAQNESLIEIEYAGVNYIDIYYRSGLYPITLPYIAGIEGAGIVKKIGEKVTNVLPGDRVAFCNGSRSYAEFAVIESTRLVKVPDQVSLDTATAAMTQGLTAHYLTHSTFPLNKNHTCLIHAAAGGVGLLTIQMAKKLGARTIGTVSSEEKARLAIEAGVDDVIVYTEKDFEAECKKLTGSKGVDVVYDSVGKVTFEKSLNCLKPLGMLVLFGQSSGAVPPFNPSILSAKGSLFLTRPTLGNYVPDHKSLSARSDELMSAISDGSLKIRIDRIYPLEEAMQAQIRLESRASSGKILLKA